MSKFLEDVGRGQNHLGLSILRKGEQKGEGHKNPSPDVTPIREKMTNRDLRIEC